MKFWGERVEAFRDTLPSCHRRTGGQQWEMVIGFLVHSVHCHRAWLEGQPESLFAFLPNLCPDALSSLCGTIHGLRVRGYMCVFPYSLLE